MEKYFDIYIEFDKKVIKETILSFIHENKKAYVCVVDGTNLSYATLDNRFKEIINSAHINISDGSSIALLSSIIHRKKLKPQIGGDLFLNGWIELVLLLTLHSEIYRIFDFYLLQL